MAADSSNRWCHNCTKTDSSCGGMRHPYGVSIKVIYGGSDMASGNITQRSIFGSHIGGSKRGLARAGDMWGAIVVSLLFNPSGTLDHFKVLLVV